MVQIMTIFFILFLVTIPVFAIIMLVLGIMIAVKTAEQERKKNTIINEQYNKIMEEKRSGN